jgi:Nuclease-related domain
MLKWEMAIMFPKVFPHDLNVKPKLAGEKIAFEAAGLDESWSVFYDRPVASTQRRVDFVAINPARGVVAIEVKGGLVHARRGAFRQLITQSGVRKRINPFGQVKLAFARVCDAAGVDILKLSMQFVMWFLHIWTQEKLERGAVASAIETALPARLDAAQWIALERLAKVLQGKARELRAQSVEGSRRSDLREPECSSDLRCGDTSGRTVSQFCSFFVGSQECAASLWITSRRRYVCGRPVRLRHA